MKRKTGFTLIELLIVVAIIAILAAIAVPNFLEAQVRSKVSRVHSDLRTIATGLESYFVDNNSYPRDHDDGDDIMVPESRWFPWDAAHMNSGQCGFYYLTTPIAYLTMNARDPFAPRENRGLAEDYVAPHYILMSGSDNMINGDPVHHCYGLSSVGPSKGINTSNPDTWPDSNYTPICSFYDPTNGTRSEGDIYRFGGSYRVGNWRIGDFGMVDKNDYNQGWRTGETFPWDQWQFGDVVPGK